MRMLWCSLVLLVIGGCGTYATLDDIEDQLIVCENTGAPCIEERQRVHDREARIIRRADHGCPKRKSARMDCYDTRVELEGVRW